MSILTASLIAIVAPLIGALIAGLLRKQIGRVGAHSITILGVGLSFALSVWIAVRILSHHDGVLDVNLYTWASGGVIFPYAMHIGLMIDSLTVVMLVIVTFVSLLVHIYSIGYMAEDEGYQRFFSYISLFTFKFLRVMIQKTTL